MFKKRYFLVILIGILSLVACVISDSNTNVSFAKSQNVEVVKPDMNKYLFLEAPSFVAVRGDVVAVYDKASNKILTAGAEHKEYEVTLLEDDEITNITFANNTLYYLTKQNKLHDVFKNEDVTLGKIIAIDVYSYNDVLYIYNSLASVYSYDGVTITEYFDTSFKIIQSTYFCATDSIAYFYKDDTVFSFDYINNKVEKTSIDIAVSDIFVLNNELYLLSDKDVIKFSNTDDKTTLEYDILGLASDNTNVVVLENNNNSIIKLDDTFVIQDTYGCSSSLKGWFNNPVAVKALKDGVAVYDKGNNRLQIIGVDDIESISLSGDFDYFTANDDYYVLSKSSIITIIKDGEPISFNSGLDIQSIAIFEDTLFIFDKSSMSIYYVDLTTDKKVKHFAYTTSTIKNLVAKSSDILYALSTDGVVTITKSYDKVSIENENIISFDVDYVGNIITLEYDSGSYFERKYTQSFGTFEKTDEIELNTGYELCDISINISNIAYSVEPNKNLLLKFDGVSFIAENDYVAPQNIDTKSLNIVSFGKVNSDTIIYNYSDNFNSISDIIEKDAKVAVLFENDLASYILTENGKVGFIKKNSLVTLETTKLSNKVTALFDTINIYNIPSTEYGQKIHYFDINKGDVLTIIDDACEFSLNGTWVKVSYIKDNVTYEGYAIKSRLMTYVEPAVEEKTEITAKVKSSRVGEKVKGYAMADETSAEMFSISDGTKVKIIGDYDENSTFTLVEYDGKQGYVLTSNLQMNDGLTNGQIAAIAIASITLIITIIYIIVVKRRKNLNN